MDARKYASKYVKPDNVRDRPIQTRIVNVFEEGRYGRLMLELDVGPSFSLNETNTSALIKSLGHDTDSWIGQEIILELSVYKDWHDDPPSEKETVKVRAIPPTKAGVQNGGASSKAITPGGAGSPRDAMDDEIPF